jgi:hypothetical protein
MAGVGLVAERRADGGLVRATARLNLPARQPDRALAARPGAPGSMESTRQVYARSAPGTSTETLSGPPARHRLPAPAPAPSRALHVQTAAVISASSAQHGARATALAPVSGHALTNSDQHAGQPSVLPRLSPNICMPLTERVKWWRQADYLFGAGLTTYKPLLPRVSFWPSVPPAPPRASSKGSAWLPSVFMRDRIDHRAPPESRALAAAPGCRGCTRCVGQRGQRVLCGDDGQPGALQALDHRRPGRAVGAVNQRGAGFGSQRARSCPSSFVRHGSRCSRLGRPGTGAGSARSCCISCL